MHIEYTNQVQIKPHCIVYGPAKSGKTRLIKTLSKPIICNTDMGLASIRDCAIPKVDCHSYADVEKFVQWLKQGNISQYNEIVFDDFTEMCSLYIKQKLKTKKDGRQAYYDLQDDMLQFLRDVRQFDKATVILLAKEDRIKDAMGNLIYAPSVPGNALQQQLPYYLGQIYRMESWIDSEGQAGPPNAKYEVLRCGRTDTIEAGDRSGRLNQLEFANLGEIINKTLS